MIRFSHRTALLALPAVLGLAAVAVPQSGVPVAEIAFRLERNKILLPVTIEGVGSAEFVLDTGSPVTGVVLTEGEMPADWRVLGQARLGGAGEGRGTTAAVVDAPPLSVGSVALDVGRLIVFPPLDALSASAGRPFRGIVGRPLFERYVVRLDFDAQRIQLYEPADWTPPAEATSLPIRIEGGHPHLDAAAVMADADTVIVDLVVDTGSRLALALDPSREVRVPGGAVPMILGHGLAGPVRGPLGRIDALLLGDASLPDIVTAFPDPQMGVTPNADGNLGIDAMKRFIVTFDYTHSRMLLEEGAARTARYAIDASGLTLRAPGPDHRRIVVSEVRPDSPAAEAGLVAGDEIVGVSGVDDAEWSLAGVEARLLAGARPKVTIRYRRGDRRFEATLTLRAPV